MMFEKATVISSSYERNGLDIVPTQLLTVSVTAPQDIRTVELMPGTGRDVRLIPGATVYILPVAGNSGHKICIADYSILPEDTDMSPGDSDIHANVAGAKVSQVKAGSDGVITLQNITNCSIEINETGIIMQDATGLNKIEIGPSGVIFTVGGITYGAATHIHPTPVGPSSAPTPGT